MCCEVEGSFVRLSPYPVESDAIPGQIVSEFELNGRIPARSRELLGMGKTHPIHLN